MIRQAMMHAIDREGIVASVLQGEGTVVNSSIFGPEWMGTPEGLNLYPFDPDMARQLLTDSGFDTSQTLSIMHQPAASGGTPEKDAARRDHAAATERRRIQHRDSAGRYRRADPAVRRRNRLRSVLQRRRRVPRRSEHFRRPISTPRTSRRAAATARTTRIRASTSCSTRAKPKPIQRSGRRPTPSSPRF